MSSCGLTPFFPPGLKATAHAVLGGRARPGASRVASQVRCPLLSLNGGEQQEVIRDACPLQETQEPEGWPSRGQGPCEGITVFPQPQNSAEPCGSLLFLEKPTGSLSQNPWGCTSVTGGAARAGTPGKTSHRVVRSPWLPCTCVCLPRAELWGSAMLTISPVEGWAES